MHFSGCVTTTLNRSSRSSVPVGQNSTHIRQPLQNWRMIVCRWPFGPTDETGSFFRNFFTRDSAADGARSTPGGFSLALETLFYRGAPHRQPLPRGRGHDRFRRTARQGPPRPAIGSCPKPTELDTGTWKLKPRAGFAGAAPCSSQEPGCTNNGHDRKADSNTAPRAWLCPTKRLTKYVTKHRQK